MTSKILRRPINLARYWKSLQVFDIFWKKYADNNKKPWISTISIVNVFVFIENYVLKHIGHCNGGFVGPNTIQNNVDGCFDECNTRRNVGYFAFNPKNGYCSCYLTTAGCPDDDLWNDFNSYQIILSNYPITLDFIFSLKFILWNNL